jgi:cell division transport system permease protein
VARTTARIDGVITFVVFSLRRAWQGFWRNAVMSLAATATMVLMLLLLAGFWIVQTGLLAGLEFTEQKVEVVAYLQPNATDTQVEALKRDIEMLPEVEEAVYITRDDALVRFRESMRAQGREDMTQYLESNPLYASLEVKLVDPAGIGVVADALNEEPIVRNVINIEDLVDRVLTVTNVLRTAGTVLLIIVGVICLFIIVNTIRLAVFARAEEIEIMRLVGASDAFIRWPFVFEGAFVGFLGAAITLGVLAAAAEPLSGFMVEFFRILPLEVGSLTRDLVLLVMGAGVGLGIVGSWVSVRTYLIR